MNESQELITQFAQSIQRIDEQVQELKDERTDIMKRAKDEGLNVKALRAAIAEIRKDRKTPENEKSEQDIYKELVMPYIHPVK